MVDSDKGSTIYPSLAGKSVLITGGASGIGADLVRGFAEQGAKVGFLDIDNYSAARLVAEVRATTSVEPWFCEADMSDPSQVETAIDAAVEALGGLHILINNVANDNRHKVEDLDQEAWRACLAVNLDSAFVAIRASLPAMKAQGCGSIINVSSTNAIRPFSSMPGYITAKAGMLGLTKAVAQEVGVDGIRVNAILPGWVLTQKQLDLHYTEEAHKDWQDRAALKDDLKERDVTNLALFLASDDSRMITGQSLVIDAGRT